MTDRRRLLVVANGALFDAAPNVRDAFVTEANDATRGDILERRRTALASIAEALVRSRQRRGGHLKALTDTVASEAALTAPLDGEHEDYEVLDSVGAVLVNESAVDARALAQIPGLRVVAPTSLPVAPLLPRDPGDDVPDTWHLTKIGAHEDPHAGHDVLVGVLDTGVAEHRELPSDRVALLDLDSGAPGSPRDDIGHGTHVTSLIGGVHCGVAPAARVLVARVLSDDGGLRPEVVARGLSLVLEKGADVVNLSLTFPGGNPVLAQMIQNGVRAYRALVVAAVGNRDRPEFPALLADVLAVGATTDSDEMWTRSAFGIVGGVSRPDLSAPGAPIYGAAPGDRYEIARGTSQAAAIVSGAAARLISRDPSLRHTPSRLRGALLSRTQPIAGDAPERGGRGRLQL